MANKKATSTTVKKDLADFARLEKIASDSAKPVKARKAALTKLDAIQRRWDSTLSKAGR